MDFDHLETNLVYQNITQRIYLFYILNGRFKKLFSKNLARYLAIYSSKILFLAVVSSN